MMMVMTSPGINKYYKSHAHTEIHTSEIHREVVTKSLEVSRYGRYRMTMMTSPVITFTGICRD